MGDSRTFIVAYDVADHRCRRHLHRLLRGFGDALQRSVFVCRLDERRLSRLRRLLSRQVLAEGDRLGLFQVAASEYLAGAEPAPLAAGDILIVESRP